MASCQRLSILRGAHLTKFETFHYSSNTYRYVQRRFFDHLGYSPDVSLRTMISKHFATSVRHHSQLNRQRQAQTEHDVRQLRIGCRYARCRGKCDNAARCHITHERIEYQLRTQSKIQSFLTTSVL